MKRSPPPRCPSLGNQHRAENDDAILYSDQRLSTDEKAPGWWWDPPGGRQGRRPSWRPVAGRRHCDTKWVVCRRYMVVVAVRRPRWAAGRLPKGRPLDRRIGSPRTLHRRAAWAARRPSGLPFRKPVACVAARGGEREFTPTSPHHVESSMSPRSLPRPLPPPWVLPAAQLNGSPDSYFARTPFMRGSRAAVRCPAVRAHIARPASQRDRAA